MQGAVALELSSVIGALALIATGAWLFGIGWFLLFFRPPAVAATGRVTLVLPITGEVATLPALFGVLAQQSLPPRRLLAAVESEADPAFAQLRALAPLLPFPLEIVVAGPGHGRSQKATNIIAALRSLDGEDDAVVLFDADILPNREWLSWLATPVLNGTADLVTGYRWHILERGGLGRHLVVWLDRALALGPRFLAAGEVWGGSVAIGRSALAQLDLPRTLDRAFSVDGAISRQARRLGLRILIRRTVLVPTPAEGGDRDALAFFRRQLQIIHLFAPHLWWLLGLTLHLEAFGALVALAALAGDITAAIFFVGIACCGGVRAVSHDHVSRRLGLREAPPQRALQLAFGLVAPFAALALLLLFWSSARTRIIRWRHVTYRVIGPGGEVEILHRDPPGGRR